MTLTLEKFNAIAADIEKGPTSDGTSKDTPDYLQIGRRAVEKDLAASHGLTELPSRGIFSETANSIYNMVTDAAPKAVAQILQGSGVPWNDHGSMLGEYIEHQEQDMAKNVPSREFIRGKTGHKSIVEGIEGGAANMPLAVGGFLAGTGAAALTPSPEPLTRLAAGAGAAAATQYAGMFRMAENDFLRQLRSAVKKAKPDTTAKEWESIKKQFKSDTRAYGAAEAGPEAVGAAFEYALLKTPVGGMITKMIGQGAAGKILSSTLGKIGVKGAGMVATEVPTEAVTEVAQREIMAGNPHLADQANAYQGSMISKFGQAVKDVAGPTIVGSLLTGGAMGAVNGVQNRVAKAVQKKDVGRKVTEAFEGFSNTPIDALDDLDLQVTHKFFSDALQIDPENEQAQAAVEQIEAETTRRQAGQAPTVPDVMNKGKETEQEIIPADPPVQNLGPVDAPTSEITPETRLRNLGKTADILQKQMAAASSKGDSRGYDRAKMQLAAVNEKITRIASELEVQAEAEDLNKPLPVEPQQEPPVDDPDIEAKVAGAIGQEVDPQAQVMVDGRAKLINNYLRLHKKNPAAEKVRSRYAQIQYVEDELTKAGIPFEPVELPPPVDTRQADLEESLGEPKPQTTPEVSTQGAEASETASPASQGPSAIQRGRDEEYGIDVEMSRTDDGGYVIKTSDPNDRDKKISSGMGGIYYNNMILNQDGEFVSPSKIAQASTGQASSENTPFKTKDAQSIVDLIAKIEFQRATGKMVEVERLESQLQEKLFGFQGAKISSPEEVQQGRPVSEMEPGIPDRRQTDTPMDPLLDRRMNDRRGPDRMSQEEFEARAQAEESDANLDPWAAAQGESDKEPIKSLSTEKKPKNEQKTVDGGVKTPVKEPWEMTLQEYEGIHGNPGKGATSYTENTFHKNSVAAAVNRGLPVPAEVLADYPDLIKKPVAANETPVDAPQTDLSVTDEQKAIAGGLIEDDPKSPGLQRRKIEKALVKAKNVPELQSKIDEMGEKQEKTPIEKLKADLEDKGAGRIEDTDVKIFESPTGNYYYRWTYNGIRNEKGPGYPATWSKETAINKAMQEAERAFGGKDKTHQKNLTEAPKESIVKQAETQPKEADDGKVVAEKPVQDIPDSGRLAGEQAQDVSKTEGAGTKGPSFDGVEGIRPGDRGRTDTDRPGDARDRGPRDRERDDERTKPGRAPAESGDRGVSNLQGDTGAETESGHSEGQSELIPEAPTPEQVQEAKKDVHAASDYTISSLTQLGQGGQKTKFKNNIAAIRLINTLESEGRQATPEEQDILARYVGWGGIPQAFDESNAKWGKEYKELKALLSDEEWDAAIQSTQYAHYTSDQVINGLYSALKHLGFNGGRVLEPGAGVGNFMGMLPVGLRGNTRFTAVERERIASKIARHLYPNHSVQTKDFTEFNTPDGYFDATIGNPPFGKTPLTDMSGRKHLSRLSIHNYFISKSVDMTREGGIVAVVVSNFFMDAKTNRVRKYIGERTEFLGAIRLPNNAFSKNANTEVTTDILFLKKLPESDFGSQAAKENGKTWQDIESIPDPLGGENIFINKYFKDNPHMMLGEMQRAGSMYGPDLPALVAKKGEKIQTAMDKAIQSLPENAFESVQDRIDAAEDASLEALADDTVDVGGHYIDENGAVYMRVDDVGGEPRARRVSPFDKISEKQTLNKAGVEKLRSLAEIRKTIRALLTAEQRDDEGMESLRKDLNQKYDAYVKKNGFFHAEGTRRIFKGDPDYPLLLSLEYDYDKGLSKDVAKKAGVKPVAPSAKKAPVFTKRVIHPYTAVTRAETPEDAITVSIAETGTLNPQYIGELLGKDGEAVLDELSQKADPPVFMDPATSGYALKEEYLSGNVRKKLKQAEAAGMSANVKALKAVLPKDKPGYQINAKFGAHWVPVDVYKDFIKEIVGDSEARVSLTYIPTIGRFNGDISGGVPLNLSTTYGTESMGADDIMLAMLAGKPIKVGYWEGTDSGGRRFVQDDGATQDAQDKAQEIKDKFGDWLFSDMDRAERLTRVYNDTMNSHVNRQYDGSWVRMVGKVPDNIIKLRRHQADAVARMLLSRQALLDHVVGAGKTFTVIGAVMEMRRMGLSKKPMITVPNHLVKQWAADFYRLYPGAKILAPSKADFQRKNRHKLLAKIATGDWDAVVIAHSQFGMIKPDPEFEMEFNKNQVAELKKAIDDLKREGGKENKRTIKNIEAMKERLEQRIKRLRDRSMDNLLDFAQLGVDSLFVDEAHMYKNLMFTTRLQNIRGMGQPQGSQRAYDMYIKTHQLYRQNGGERGVFFATGTPVSNSLSEMYHMMRYLQPSALEYAGHLNFDSWVNTFAEIETVWMQALSGEGFKATTRLGNFANMNELMKIYGQVADTVSNKQIQEAYAEDNNGKEFPIPKLKNGKRTPVSVTRSKALEDYMVNTIADRAKALKERKGPPKKGEDNMLSLMSDARMAAMDMRMVDRSIRERDPDSRIAVASKKVIEKYNEFNHVNGTQLVFSDLGVPKKHARKELKEYRELTAKAGVLENEHVLAMAQLGDKAAAKKVAEAEDALKALDNKGPDWKKAVDLALRGFSVYDDMKSALIEGGIPEKEIAFIHDYNTDLQKATLFKAVNDGKIRVVLGSTSKMGAGTNMQERLVALHHLDVPWKPSDIEQREGRIIRQGNRLLNEVDGFEIEIMAYATQDTLDLFMWQTQEKKLSMITKMREGEVEDEMDNAFEEMQMSANEMQAAATSNPYLLEEIQVRDTIRKLERKSRSFVGQQQETVRQKRNAEMTIRQGPKKVEKLQAFKDEAQKVADARKAENGKATATVDGAKLTGYSNIQKVVMEKVDAHYQPIEELKKSIKDHKKALSWIARGKEEQAKAEIADLEAQLKERKKNRFSIEFNGKVFKSGTAVADAVVSHLGDLNFTLVTPDGDAISVAKNLGRYISDKTEEAGIEDEQIHIGKIGEFDVTVSAHEFEDAGGNTAYDPVVSIDLGKIHGGDVHSSSTFIVVREMEGMIRPGRVSGDISGMNREMETAKATLKNIKDADLNKKWPHQDELDSARARHRELLRLLADIESGKGEKREQRVDWRRDLLPGEGLHFQADMTERNKAYYSKKKLSDQPGITLNQIKNHPLFKTAKVRNHKNGIYVKFPNGKGFFLEAVEEIDGGGVKLKTGQRIAGKYQSNEIQISKAGNRYTVTHEMEHWMEDTGILTQRDKSALNRGIRKAGGKPSSEARAQFVEKAFIDRDSQTGIIKRVLQKIADFIDGMINLAGRRTARGVVRDMEKGKAFEMRKGQIKAVHFSHFPLKHLSKKFRGYKFGWEAGEGTYGPGFYATDPENEKIWKDDMDRLSLGDHRYEVTLSPKNPLVITQKEAIKIVKGLPANIKAQAVSNYLKQKMIEGGHDALIVRVDWEKNEKNWAENYAELDREFVPKIPGGKKIGKFTNVDEYHRLSDDISKKRTGLTYRESDLLSEIQNEIFIPPEHSDIVEGFGPPATTGAPSYQQTAPYFYSQMQQFLEAKLPGRGTPAQMKQMIQNFAKKGQFKAEELEWSGVEDWLDQQTGKVTKKEVLGYLAANQVEVQEVVKRMETGKDYEEELNHLSELSMRGELTDEQYDRLSELDEMAADNFDASTDTPPKYFNYQIPGGENYKELLLTLPRKRTAVDDKIFALESKESSGGLTESDAEMLEELMDQREGEIESNTDVYKTTHFDEPNVLAHVRFNERTDAEGNRVLFVEEVQSDWHQSGRKKGYKGVGRQKNGLPKGWEANVIGKDARGRDNWAVFDANGEQRTPGFVQKMEAVLEATSNQNIGADIGVPNAPFKKTWPMLAMKRMVRYAAENGFDKIAWTPGEVQAERYDLSKQISKVGWYPNSDSSGQLIAKGNSGDTVINEFMPPDKVEDYVGKDIAQRLIDSPNKDLSGLDLKVGGEGMKGFYDKILPAEVNKFFGKKAWGKARVGVSEIGGDTRPINTFSLLKTTAGWAVFDGNGDQASETFSNREQAVKEKAEMENSTKGTQVHSLPITPQMKQKAVFEGMPQFSIKDTKTATIATAKAFYENMKPENRAQWDWLRRIYKTMEYDNTPAGQMIWAAAQRRMEERHEIFNKLNAFDDQKISEMLQALKFKGQGRLSKAMAITDIFDPSDKRISKEYRQVWKAIDDMDTKRIQWLDQTDNSGKLVDGMRTTMEKAGASKEVIDVLDAMREAYDEALDLYLAEIKDTIAEYTDNDMDVPTLYNDPKTGRKVTLIDAYKEMQQLKGFYAPRIRENGDFKVIFTKDGVQHLRIVKTRGEANRLVASLKDKKGYAMFMIKPNERIQEDILKSLMLMEVSAALDNAAKGMDADPETRAAFRAELIQNMANMLKARGYKTHTIHRNEGPLVRGYIEDPAHRFLLYTNRLAGGIAKGRAGKKMMEALVGINEKFERGTGDHEGQWVLKADGNVIETREMTDMEKEGKTVRAFPVKAQKAKYYREGDLWVRRDRKGDEVDTKPISKKDMETPRTGDTIKSASVTGKIIADEGRNWVVKSKKDGKDKWVPKGKHIQIVTSEREFRIGDKYEDFVMEGEQWVLRDDKGEIVQARPVHPKHKELKKHKYFSVGGVDAATEQKRHNAYRKFIEEQMRNADATDRAIAVGKSIVTFKYLGFNPRSAVVNMTAMLTTAPAAIHEYAMDGKGSFSKIGKAISRAGVDYARVMKGKKLLDKKEQKFMEWMQEKGYDQPQYTMEAMRNVEGAYGQAWGKAMNGAMWMFGTTEQWNRGTTMLAAYRLAVENGSSHKDAIEKARKSSNRAHGVYDKSTMPLWAMGDHPAAKIAQMGYTYQKFAHNYLQMMGELITKKNYKALAFALISPGIVGGAASSLAFTAAFAVAKQIMRMFGDDRDPEKFFYDFIREHLGDYAERTTRYGAAGAMGVNLSGSLAVGMEVPKDFMDLIGPFGGVAQDIQRAGHYMKTGQPLRAVESALPTMAANIPRAFRESKTGAVTQYGNRVWDEQGKPYMPTVFETGLRGAGFGSARKATVQARQWESKKIMARFADKKADIYESLRAYIADPSEEKRKKVYERVDEFNKRVKDAKLLDIVPLITQNSIKNQMRRMAGPTKRIRAIFK